VCAEGFGAFMVCWSMHLSFFLFASFPLTVFLCFGSCFFSFCWGDNFLRHKRWDILLQIYIRWHSWTRERFSSKQETPYNWLIDAWTSFRSIHYIFFLYFTWIQFCSWWLLFLSKAKQGSCLCIIAPELLGLRSLHKRSTGLFCDSFSVWFRIVAADLHRLHSSQACQRSKDYCSVNTMILWRLLVTSVAKWRWKMRAERTSDTNDTTNSSLNDDWWTTPVGKPGSTLSRLKMFPCEQFQFSARHTARLCNGILWKPAIP